MCGLGGVLGGAGVVLERMMTRSVATMATVVRGFKLNEGISS